LIAHITDALTHERECAVSREDLEVLWSDGQCHPDERLMRIHKLAGLCNAEATVAPGLRRATFVRAMGQSHKSEDTRFIARARRISASVEKT